MIVPIYNDSNNGNPVYAHPGDAGCDLKADFSSISLGIPLTFYGKGGVIYEEDNKTVKAVWIDPMTRVIIPTGIYTAIPEGYEVQIRPRSGLAIKKGLTLINSIGTIDVSYKGCWGVPVINLGTETIWIEDGERIAQAILNKVERIEWEDHTFEEIMNIGTDRGGGFGSSGSK